MTEQPSPTDGFVANWQQQLAHVVDTVREMSRQTDPQAMVAHYRKRLSRSMPTDQSISLSRRGLSQPKFRITRHSKWEEDINPWKQRDALPCFEGGLLADLLWSDQPRIIDDLVVPEDDPAFSCVSGYRSLLALPLYDGGVALNMVVLFRKERAAFVREDFPNLVLTGNLFGRATHNLVLAGELRDAYDAVDAELEAIADIQRSLLPAELPVIPTMQIAVHYQTARRAGGDYYDFFELDEGKWGILIADVSGHGTPAAVLMAVTHSLVHADLEPTPCPGKMLERLNALLYRKYTCNNGTFVTAFYGVYDPATRKLVYASAGHNPPRVKRCEDGSVFSLDAVGGFPLGVVGDESYETQTHQLKVGDQIIFYTDGITETMDPEGNMFCADRLDTALGDCMLYASDLIQRVLDAVNEFAGSRPADDDRTVIVAKVT